MELANKAGARHALLIGDDELAQGRYGLKNMESGEQRPVDEQELLGILEG
jgi:histidyl-tRNA synthetase